MKTISTIGTLARALIPCLLASPIAVGSPLAAPQSAGRPAEEAREDLRETVEIYMLARMRRALALDDDQARTVIPLVEDLNASRREFNIGRRDLLHRLMPLVDRGGGEKEILEILATIDDLERRHRAKEAETQAAIRAELTPVQQARFLLFVERFRREMEERVRGLMEARPPADAPGRRPRGGPSSPPER